MEMSESNRKRIEELEIEPPEAINNEHKTPVGQAELEHVSPYVREARERRDFRTEIETHLNTIGSYEEQITNLVSKIDKEKSTIEKLIGKMPGV
ncbi:MAG: hypothetical protein LBI42_03885 [Chitinispirillales bacterium]|jgi:uncharacterized coiled-coil DUF342 family protein|nr:hypothetical protein [Chitinispirillales bacterium]